jgi:hypothetical protein
VIVSSLLLFCCTALPADALPATSASPATAIDSSSDAPGAEGSKAKPDGPSPKVIAAMTDGLDPAAGSALPAAKPIASVPVQPAATESFETPRKRMIWYGLLAAGHGTAAFDAWSTRRAISGGYGTEGDPLQRPFASSGAIYATTQITPLIMDYVGHRMMRSRSALLRRFWWVPQTASASVSLGAGIHNYRVVP